MAGGSLAEWLYQRPNFTFNAAVQLSIATEMATALAFLHSMSVVHRDLKSDNVLMDRDGMHAKIADIGLAKVRSPSSYYMTEAAGTVMFMAPEMLSGEKYATPVDVYAYGLVLFELHMQQRPFPLKLGRDKDAMRVQVC